MTGLVGGPLLVGGLGPPAPPLPLNPAVAVYTDGILCLSHGLNCHDSCTSLRWPQFGGTCRRNEES